MPPRPEGFVCESVDMGDSGFPKRLPAGAEFVADFEWGSPGGSGSASFWLSINRAHTLWLLWYRAYDEEDFGRHPFVCACGPYMKIPPKIAASYLILAHWETYLFGYDSVEGGLLTAEELKVIAQQPEVQKLN